MKAFLDCPGSARSPMLLIYSSESPTVHGCLISYTSHTRRHLLSATYAYKPLKQWLKSSFLTSCKYPGILNTPVLCEHPLSKNHIAPSAGPKQAVRMVLWEACGFSHIILWLQKYFKMPLSLQSLTGLYKKQWACNSFLYNINDIKQSFPRWSEQRLLFPSLHLYLQQIINFRRHNRKQFTACLSRGSNAQC